MSRDDLGRAEAPPRLPTRLIEGTDDTAAALRALERRTRADGLEEAAAWRSLVLRAPASTVRRWFWSGAFVAAAAAAALIVRRAPVETVATRPPEPVPVVERLAPAPVPTDDTKVAAPEANPHGPAPARASGGPRRLALSPRAIALETGEAALADEATVELAPHSAARASADDAWVRVVLERGQVGPKSAWRGSLSYLLQLRHGARELLGVAPVQVDDGPRANQRLRGARPDAVGGAGDDDVKSFQGSL